MTHLSIVPDYSWTRVLTCDRCLISCKHDRDKGWKQHFEQRAQKTLWYLSPGNVSFFCPYRHTPWNDVRLCVYSSLWIRGSSYWEPFKALCPCTHTHTHMYCMHACLFIIIVCSEWVHQTPKGIRSLAVKRNIPKQNQYMVLLLLFHLVLCLAPHAWQATWRQ